MSSDLFLLNKFNGDIHYFRHILYIGAYLEISCRAVMKKMVVVYWCLNSADHIIVTGPKINNHVSLDPFITYIFDLSSYDQDSVVGKHFGHCFFNMKLGAGQSGGRGDSQGFTVAGSRKDP